MLLNKDAGERTITLEELCNALDPSNLQTNKTRSQAVLDNKAEMDVLLDLSDTTRIAFVAGNALCVLQRLAWDDDNAKRLLHEHPSVVPVAMRKLESGAENATEGVLVNALGVLNNLARNVGNARNMAVNNPTLVSLLMAKVKSGSEQVQIKALGVLRNLALNVDNAAKMMVAYSAVLLPLLVSKMHQSTALHATKVVYGLSSFPANWAILRRNNLVVAALTEGRKSRDIDICLFSILALINLFGAEENPNLLKTNLATLQAIFKLIARAMSKEGWSLNEPLLAFRYLCVVEHNRQLLWDEYKSKVERKSKGKDESESEDESEIEYKSKFLTSILTALQRAIDGNDTFAAENAMSILDQFSNDIEPFAWMHNNKPQLDLVFAQLAPFPDALKTAQVLQLALEPAPVASSSKAQMVEGGQGAAATVAPPVPMQPVPQNEAEICQWLSKYAQGEDIADTLVKRGFVEAGALKTLSEKSWGELKAALELNAMQALTLENALRELF